MDEWHAAKLHGNNSFRLYIPRQRTDTFPNRDIVTVSIAHTIRCAAHSGEVAHVIEALHNGQDSECAGGGGGGDAVHAVTKGQDTKLPDHLLCTCHPPPFQMESLLEGEPAAKDGKFKVLLSAPLCAVQMALLDLNACYYPQEVACSQLINYR